MVVNMDNVICPNCGTPNPPDHEVCQVCHARLPVETSESEKDDRLSSVPEERQDSKSSFELDDDFISALEDLEFSLDLSEENLDKTIEELGEGQVTDDELEDEVTLPDESESKDAFPEWLISLAGRDFDEERMEIFSDIQEEEQTSRLSSNLPSEEFSEKSAETEKSAADSEGEGEEPGKQIETKEDEEGLEQAELPDWLEAMRPVEYVAPTLPSSDAPEEHLESEGPLAGIWGALQPETELVSEVEPKGTSVALLVSDNHRIHAELLKTMLEGGEKPSSLPARIEDATQNLLRWIIAIILLITIIWSLIDSNNPQNPQSWEVPSEVVSVYNLINTLSAEDRVLIAFEYEPGLSPELNAAAQPVVDHLLIRGAYLTLVSTSPVGPLLAERFIDSTQRDHSVSKNINYVNLGYIPASTAGLLSFSQSPQRILPFTIESEPAWGGRDQDVMAPLKGIYAVEDYKMVLVIVEQPEVARAWIEQVLPYLRASLPPTPMVMVSSAQAEPLIRPYYEAIPRQIQGLVTGLAGGTSYANLTGREGLGMGYWVAYDRGLIAASLLIFLGGVIILLINLRNQRQENNGEEAE
jgi:hypothetical protein